MRRLALVAGIVGFLGTAAPAPADVKLSGLADVVFRNSAEEDLTNLSFNGTSNLNSLRTRIFLDSNVTENTAFFAQILYAANDFHLYGAYARFGRIGGAPVNLHVGLIPTTVGTFAERTYSDKNPLVGTPLVHNHHTTLNPFVPQTSIDDLRAARDERTEAGLPVVYDSCWNTGAEVFGSVGAFDWSLAAVSGSVTKPAREQVNKAPQGTARLAWSAGPVFRFGLSGFVGPYLWEDLPGITFPEDRGPIDYLNAGAGYDLHAASRFFDVRSEFFWARWAHPNLPTLQAVSGYVEGKYKFVPGWYAAARLGFFDPNEVDDGSGGSTMWDYSLARLEYGVGYRPHRRVIAKVVAQHNRFDNSRDLDRDHYLIQLSTAF